LTAHPSIIALVQQHLPGLTLEAREIAEHAVYCFSLKLFNGHELSRALRTAAASLTKIPASDRTQMMRDFRERVVYSRYVLSDFWRAMYLYVTGRKYRSFVTVYPVHREDLVQCEMLLTEKEYLRLLQIANTASTYRISDSEYQWVLQQAVPIARSIAYRKLRYLEQYDPAFDAASELVMEATRLANHYSYFPDPGRILNYIRVGITREAERRRDFHMAQQRRRVSKLTEWRCPTCKTEWEHEKNRGVVNLAWLVKKEYLEEENEYPVASVFCQRCTTEADAPVQLEHIERDRIYQSTCTSIDAVQQSADGGDTTLGNSLPDDNAAQGDDEAANTQFVEQLSQQLCVEDRRFLTIFLEGDDGFNRWLAARNVRGVSSVHTQANLVAEYLNMSYEDVKDRLGAVLGKPQAYVVRVGDEGDDLVFARSPSLAVHYVAQHYRFKNGSTMQEHCGKVRVREHYGFDPDLVEVKEGQIIPLPE